MMFLICSPFASAYEEIEFSGGVTATIDYTVDGSVSIYDAHVTMVEPAHILDYIITASGAVLDIYGGQIDYLLMISMNDMTLPDGVVTVYGNNFAVDGVPVDPETTELFLMGETLSGTYADGTAFSYPVDCVIVGGAGYVYYQTVKLGWIASEPDIELLPVEHDFGQTDIGEINSTTVTIYNAGNAGLTVQSLSLEQDLPIQFDFITPQTLPFTLEPDTTINIEILYSPAYEGLAEATFIVFSNDPDTPILSTELMGAGINVVLSPAEKIAVITEVFEEMVQNGLITGVGNTKSAANKIETFENMIATANELIAGGYEEYALDVLTTIEAKCDGHKSPSDFIEGDGAVELNLLINEIIDTLLSQ